MKSIETKEELWDIISKLKKIGLREIISNENKDFSGELSDVVSKQGIRNNWASSLFRLNYQGQDVAIKTPKLISYLTILMSLAFENLINQNYLVSEGLTSSVARELQTYSYLSKKGFPTFNPRTDLLMDEKRELKFKDVLITDWVEGINGIDLLNDCKKETAESYIFNAMQNLSELHQCGVIWGDPSPRNSMETENGLIFYDFGLLKPNEGKLPTFLKVKDLVTLVLTSIHYSGIPAGEGMEDAAIEGYSPDTDLRRALQDQISNDLNYTLISRLNPLSVVFPRIKYGLSPEQVLASKERMLKLVA